MYAPGFASTATCHKAASGAETIKLASIHTVRLIPPLFQNPDRPSTREGAKLDYEWSIISRSVMIFQDFVAVWVPSISDLPGGPDLGFFVCFTPLRLLARHIYGPFRRGR